MKTKKLVALGIRKKGEKGFKIITSVNLVSNGVKTEIPVTWKHDRDIFSINMKPAVINYGELMHGNAKR